MKNLRLFAFLFVAAAMVTFSSCNKDDDDDVTVIDFESIELPEEGYINNKSLTLEGVTFYNNFNEQYSSWFGFAYSNCTDKTTNGYINQYSVFGDGGYKSKQFAVAYYSHYNFLLDGATPHFQFANQEEKLLENVMITNGTYLVLAITEGKDAPAKIFKEGDWFKVIFTGYKADGTKIEKPVEFYLADFRDGKTDICKTWKEVDLKPLGKVNKVTITFDGTDMGDFGPNTPTYVCLDNLTYWNE